jgi:hypothetical protein
VCFPYNIFQRVICLLFYVICVLNR